MDKEAITQRVQSYLQAERTLDAHQTRLRELANARDEAKQNLIKALPQGEAITIGTPLGKLHYKEVKVTSGISKTVLRDALEAYWAKNHLPGSSADVSEYVWSNRPSSSKWDLEFKPAKQN